MFYDKLLDLCVQKNISPTAAAEAIGMTGSHVTRWKKGFVPLDTTILKLAQYFEVPPSYFAEKEKPAAENGELEMMLERLRESSATRALLHSAADRLNLQSNLQSNFAPKRLKMHQICLSQVWFG